MSSKLKEKGPLLYSFYLFCRYKNQILFSTTRNNISYFLRDVSKPTFQSTKQKNISFLTHPNTYI